MACCSWTEKVGCIRLLGQQVACHVLKGDLELEIIKQVMEVPLTATVEEDRPMQKASPEALARSPHSCRCQQMAVAAWVSGPWSGPFSSAMPVRRIRH